MDEESTCDVLIDLEEGRHLQMFYVFPGFYVQQGELILDM